MDISLLLTIIGTLATVAFGIIGLNILKKIKYPGEISYVRDNAKLIFDSIIHDFPEYEILYRKERIGKNVKYWKICLLNTGAIDITKDLVEENLKLSFPENLKILEAKITKATHISGKKLSILKSNQIEIDLGLFKIDDFVEFDVFGELISEEKIKNFGLHGVFSQRIANTNPKVNRVVKPNLNETKKEFNEEVLRLVSMTLILISIICLFTNSEYFVNKAMNDIGVDFNTITFQDEDGKEILPLIAFDSIVTIVSDTPTTTIDTISFTDLEDIEKYSLKLKNISKEYITRPIVSFLDSIGTYIIVGGVFFYILVCYYFLNKIPKIRKKERLIKVLNKREKESSS